MLVISFYELQFIQSYLTKMLVVLFDKILVISYEILGIHITNKNTIIRFHQQYTYACYTLDFILL